jgi:hypothetical protein
MSEVRDDKLDDGKNEEGIDDLLAEAAASAEKAEPGTAPEENPSSSAADAS